MRARLGTARVRPNLPVVLGPLGVANVADSVPHACVEVFVALLRRRQRAIRCGSMFTRVWSHHTRVTIYIYIYIYIYRHTKPPHTPHRPPAPREEGAFTGAPRSYRRGCQRCLQGHLEYKHRGGPRRYQ